jgi:hypothetical protein
MHLLRILEKGSQSAPEKELRHQFRQIVLFRDGAEEGLAELLKVHRRLAATHGWRVSPLLARFYRGLALVNESARRLANDRDSLRDGLENVRMQVAIGKFQELLSFEHLNRNIGQYAPALLELPKRLDEALTVLEGYAHIPSRVHQTAGQRQDSTAMGAALLLVMAGLALLADYLRPARDVPGLESRVCTAALVLMGALLLSKFIGRR